MSLITCYDATPNLVVTTHRRLAVVVVLCTHPVRSLYMTCVSLVSC